MSNFLCYIVYSTSLRVKIGQQQGQPYDKIHHIHTVKLHASHQIATYTHRNDRISVTGVRRCGARLVILQHGINTANRRRHRTRSCR